MADHISKERVLDILKKAENSNYGDITTTKALNECIMEVMKLPIVKVYGVNSYAYEIDLSNDGRTSTWGKFDDSY